MQKQLNLSYIISTRNRLEYLKILMPILLDNIHKDEEIVVVDGQSTDGSQEFLQNLHENGLIHQFISEPDKNQAHGWNKALLMARGTLIKKLIDDDVFCFDAIRECKNFMLSNNSVDVCISNDLSHTIGSNLAKINFQSRLAEFSKWKENKVKSFTFGDVHMLIRKSSLAFLGVYDTSFRMMDWEYSLRISYLNANIAYYTGYNAMSLAHPASITSNTSKKIYSKESERACPMYEYGGDKSSLPLWSKVKIFIGKTPFYRYFKKEVENRNVRSLEDSYSTYYDLINKYHIEHKSLYEFYV